MGVSNVINSVRGGFTRLFPTKFGFFIFSSYIGLAVLFGILVTLTQNKNNTYSYSVTTAVLLVEVLKLLTATIVHLFRDGLFDLLNVLWNFRKVLLFYLVPGILYAISNNLYFINLSIFDPVTLLLLLQLRVLVTGVLYQLLFKKRLSWIQWLSLVVLTVGCAVKQLDISPNHVHGNPPVSKNEPVTSAQVTAYAPREDGQGFVYRKDALASLSPHHNGSGHIPGLGTSHYSLATGFCLIFIQILCSCFAGVYNERLLKNYSADLNIVLQNIFMYLDSSLCNILLLCAKGEIVMALSPTALYKIFLSPTVMGVVVTSATFGLTTSVFLRYLNSIMKVFAAAIEPVLLAILCYIIFGFKITVFTVISIVLVVGATALYATNPLPVPDSDQQPQSPPLLKSSGRSSRFNSYDSSEGGKDII